MAGAARMNLLYFQHSAQFAENFSDKSLFFE